MSVSGVPLALGSVAVLVAASAASGRMGSAATRPMIFDGMTLEIDEDLADRAESAWETYAGRYLGARATEVPTRAHYRTLAGKLQADARRRAPRNEMERAERGRLERAAETLFQLADHVDQFRSGMAGPRAPRRLNKGDRVRVKGRVPFVGLEEGKTYEVHLTDTLSGVPMVTFRKVDEAGRATKYAVGPFEAKGVHAHLKPMDYEGIAGGLVVERIAPLALPG